VLIDGEEIPPNNNDARLALEITAPVFSPDGWRIAFGLNGVHIYSILENTDEVLLENDLEAGSLDNTLYTPIYFSPGGNNLYIHQSTRSGPGLIVLSSWTGERYAGPLPGPCCQPIMNADQDAVIFSGQDKYGNSAGLWVIDVWYDQLTQILPPPESGQTYQVNAFPFQSEDGSLMFFYALADGGEAPPLMLARAADDGTSLLQVIRGDSYQNLQDALWADDGAFVLVVDPTDGKIKKLMANDTPPIILPVSGTMMRWGG
jgi:Tol biopolymer transport system component